MLVGVSDPDYQGEIQLLFHGEIKEEYVYNKEIP